MVKYTNLNDFVRVYTLGNQWGIGNMSPEVELKTLKEKLSNVPVFVKDFKRTIKRKGKRPEERVYEINDLQSRVEMTQPDNWWIGDCMEIVELDMIADRIARPFPRISLYGGELESDFLEKYPLDEVILPIGATRVVSSSSRNIVCILYEKDNKLQYLEMIMVREPL